jgi:hypothetical protein
MSQPRWGVGVCDYKNGQTIHDWNMKLPRQRNPVLPGSRHAWSYVNVQCSLRYLLWGQSRGIRSSLICSPACDAVVSLYHHATTNMTRAKFARYHDTLQITKFQTLHESTRGVEVGADGLPLTSLLSLLGWTWACGVAGWMRLLKVGCNAWELVTGAAYTSYGHRMLEPVILARGCFRGLLFLFLVPPLFSLYILAHLLAQFC